jgi:hypothetical protein
MKNLKIPCEPEGPPFFLRDTGTFFEKQVCAVDLFCARGLLLAQKMDKKGQKEGN